jgi:exopolyphosphatase/guanosine-5'-triphosphate,3'-diphosphate pyrophosphatase
MLSLASANVEPNLRADLAADWALRKRWIGITNRERGMLAASLMANAGRMELPEAWRNLASAEELREAQIWGLAVRLCRRFSGSSARSLSSSALVTDETTLKLVVAKPYDTLVNDGVTRDLKALGAMLGLKAGCRIVTEEDALR